VICSTLIREDPEFGLTQEEILAAFDAGQLQYRVGVIHGNPEVRVAPQGQQRKPAAAALVALGLFVALLAVLPGAVPALDALGRFVAKPAISLLLLKAGLGRIPKRWRRK